MSAMERLLGPLRERMQMMVGRAVIAAVNDDGLLQSLQIEMLADEVQDGVEHMQPYGLAYHPKPGAESIAISVGGLRSHAVVLTVADRRYRLKALQEGEVALYDDLGQKLHLTREGIVIDSPLPISITSAGDISVVAAGTLLLDGADVLVGGEGGLDAARKTDAVSGGSITGGSSKVKIA